MSSNITSGISSTRIQLPISKASLILTWLKSSGLILSVIITLTLFIAIEDISSRAEWINSTKYPPALDILAMLGTLIASGDIVKPLTSTLTTWVIALFASMLLALVMSLIINLNQYMYYGSRSILEFIRPIPSTALIPLVILSLGANADGALFLTCFGTAWQLLPIFLSAVRSVDPVALDTARSFNVSRIQVILFVILPSMYPYFLTALRIGAAASLVLLISMEYLAGINGIGKEVAVAYAGSNATRMYAYIIVASLLGILSNTALAKFVDSKKGRQR